MPKTLPTEDDLDLGPTIEEQETLAKPIITSDDEEYPIGGDSDDDPASEHLVAPKAEEKPVRVKDPTTGKFVAKPKEGDEAKVEPVEERKVDLRALQEARAENKLITERMNTLLEVLNKREARAAKAEEPAPPTVPDKIVDPLGYIEHLEGRLGKIEGESKAQTEARQATERDNEEFQQIQAVTQPQINEAVAADPTFVPTYEALLLSLAREICFVNGIPPDKKMMTPAQAAFVGDQLTKLERSHMHYAVSTGQNVAEYMKNFAAVRGVTAATPVVPAAPQLTTPPPKTIAERREAQGRHMSIGDMPGSAAPSKVSAKELANMSPKEFAAFAKKMGDDGLDELFKQA